MCHIGIKSTGGVMQSSLHSWDPMEKRYSANDDGYSFVSPAEKGLWYQSWSFDAGDVGGQVSDRLVSGHSSCLQMTQPTDKPASRSSPTVLVLPSTCLHCRGTLPDVLLGMLVACWTAYPATLCLVQLALRDDLQEPSALRCLTS